MLRAATGIKSIEVGGRLLQALIRAPDTSLKELAAAGRMSPSKAHRYLASFIEIGLVRQDPRTRHYALGDLAFQLGLAALRSYRPLQEAAAMLVGLRERFDETFMLSVWGTNGPTVVQILDSSQPVVMTMRVGAILPITAAASGFVYGAYLPRAVTVGFLGQEADDPVWLDLLAGVRRNGYAYNKGRLMPGVCAIAVPIFDWTGVLLAVIAAMGRDECIAPELRPDLVGAMKCVAESIGRVSPAGS